MTASTETERFEAWYEENIGDENKPVREAAFSAWQAARRAPEVPQEPTSKQVVLGAGALLGQPEHTADNRHPDWHSAVEKVRKVYLAMLAAAPQPPEAPLVSSIAVTPEMVEAANEAYCPFGDMELALCAALQVAPIPPGAAPVPQGWKLVPVELLDRATESLGSFVSDHGWGQADMDTFDDLSALAAAQKPPEAAPVQLPENLREGEPYDNPAFEALARALGVWGTAQSAVCAQFWLATTPAQSVVLPEPALYVSGGQLEKHCDPEDTNGGSYIPARKTAAGLFTAPLYTEQQVRKLLAAAKVERKPLTDEAIRTLYGESDGHWQMVGPQVLCFARSIESAHGIQEQST